MSKPTLPQTSKALSANVVANKGTVKRQRRKSRSNGKNGDVLISAVVSSYLLTHLPVSYTHLTLPTILLV